MQPQVYYPFKPFIITQHWGAPNSTYAQQFNDPNFKLHNGIDANTGKFNWDGSVKTEYPVFCPVEGFRVGVVESQPNGGGNQVGLVSKEKIQVGDKLCYASFILCHAKKTLVPVGYEPEIGELIMIADNTGFSTGLHTHIGMYRLDDHMRKLDSNDATGSTNPELFFTGKYAVDVASVGTLVKSGLRYASYAIGG